MCPANQINRGSRVYANSIDGRVERIVWEDLGDSILLCSEPQYLALKAGVAAPMPIGFPRTEIALIHDEKR